MLLFILNVAPRICPALWKCLELGLLQCRQSKFHLSDVCMYFIVNHFMWPHLDIKKIEAVLWGNSISIEDLWGAALKYISYRLILNCKTHSMWNLVSILPMIISSLVFSAAVFPECQPWGTCITMHPCLIMQTRSQEIMQDRQVR